MLVKLTVEGKHPPAFQKQVEAIKFLAGGVVKVVDDSTVHHYTQHEEQALRAWGLAGYHVASTVDVEIGPDGLDGLYADLLKDRREELR